MNYYKKQPQMTLSDRLAIEVAIERKESFKAIAKRLSRHPSTIAHKLKENRTFIHDNYPGGNDCKFARQCAVQHIYGEDDFCNYRC
ncbi:MAG: helix-turn-helix domain-containing protein [Lachnospiraceae bacterium]|nr:helix-turn-helix domain-containing protein [Lachnospiraceae bacterium]